MCDAAGGGGGGGGRGGGNGGGRGNVDGGGGSRGGGGRPILGGLTVVGLRRICQITRDTQAKDPVKPSGRKKTNESGTVPVDLIQ